MEPIKKISELTAIELWGRTIEIKNSLHSMKVEVTKVTETQIQCGNLRFSRLTGMQKPRQRFGWYIVNF